MAVRNGGVLYVPVAFRPKGRDLPLHRRILKDAGLEHIGRSSPENMGGCYIKIFMGTVVLKGESGDFGPLQEQNIILPHIEAALRRFFRREKVAIHEIATGELDS
jgi:hypothetical protein